MHCTCSNSCTSANKSGAHSIGKSIKTHLYWCMKNCTNNPDKLRQLIMNIPLHYMVCSCWYTLRTLQLLRHSFILQGHHAGCHPTAPCHVPRYSPSKVKLTNQRAVEQLVKHLKATYIYQNPKAFCRVYLMCF